MTELSGLPLTKQVYETQTVLRITGHVHFENSVLFLTSIFLSACSVKQC